MYYFKVSLQFATLDKAAELHPDALWWIKTVGCDIVAGLGDSVTKKWSGDVDLNDGLLLEKYTKYTERLSFISSIGLKERANRMQIATDVNKLVGDVEGDLSFLSLGTSIYMHVHQSCTYVFMIIFIIII